jgi:hypothetical protein
MSEILETSSRLNEAALATRLRMAELASTDECGAVNLSWLVLHIWLAQCDMVRSDHLRRNDKVTKPENPSNGLLGEYRRLFKQVLPAVLPLMHEFSDPEMFRVWREAGYFEEPADDPRFIDSAISVGLPISAEDLIYALGSDGPYGKDAFLTVAKQVQSARAH